MLGDPLMPMTWDALRALWDERDSRYRSRRVFRTSLPLHMSPQEATAVRDYRRSETEMLPAPTRRLAFLELNRWMPPAPR
jgi:hypothetical protein